MGVVAGGLWGVRILRGGLVANSGDCGGPGDCEGRYRTEGGRGFVVRPFPGARRLPASLSPSSPFAGKPASVREGPGFDGQSKGRILEFAFSRGNGRKFAVCRFSGPGKEVISLGWPWRTGSVVGDGRGRKGFGDPCVGRVARVGRLGRRGPHGAEDGVGALVFSGGPSQGLSCRGSCFGRGVCVPAPAVLFRIVGASGVGEDSPPLADPFPGLASDCRSPPFSVGQRNSFFGKPTPSQVRAPVSGKPSKGVRP